MCSHTGAVPNKAPYTLKRSVGCARATEPHLHCGWPAAVKLARTAFDEVEAGEYFLVAGTDTDNNGLICENGEACAEYPVNGLPEKIVIGDEPLSGVRLSTSFRRPTISALGLPRVGFEGYRLKSAGEKGQGDMPTRSLESPR